MSESKVVSMDSTVNGDDISMVDITQLHTIIETQDQVQPSTSQVQSSHEVNDIDCLDSVIPYATCHIRRTADISFQDHAETIARRLQSSNHLMQDDLTSEQLRTDMLKAMPQCLAIRKLVKSKLHTTVQQQSKKKPITYWKWLKYKISFTFRKTHIIIQEIEHIMELWYHTIKSIEGQFGSGVAVYFKFLRWLILLNIIFALMSIIFIVLPQSLDKVYLSSPINAVDFITGSGFFENTIMYYGFYNNGTVEKMFSSYSIPSAYFITLFCAYTFTFIVFSIKVILSYRKHYIEIRGGVHHFYCNKVFCGWDFAISSTKAASLQSISIYRELQEHIAEAEKHSRHNCFVKFYIGFTRILISIISIVMIFGIGGVLWVLLVVRELDKSRTTSLIIVPVIITIVMNAFAVIISFLAKMERYSSKRNELYVTVIRIHALAAVVISTLLAFWLIHSTTGCWQTELGEEIYRLICLDFIISILISYIVEATRSTLYIKGWEKIGRTEFNIAHSTLNLIYNQMLFWLGCYFSPLLSLVIVIKMILIFYIKKHSLFKYCEPPSRPWRAAQTQTLFLALSFVAIISVLIMIGYIITNVQSNECGPFKGHSYIWEYVVDGVLELKRDSAFWLLVSEFAKPSVGAVILIAMCVGVYWLRAKAQANKEMMKILQDMLVSQECDKQFLLKGFANITNSGKLYRRSDLNRSTCHVADQENNPILSKKEE